MSQNLQEVFSRVEKSTRRVRELKAIYRDALAQNDEYQEVKEKLDNLKNRKKQIEEATKEQFEQELTELEDLKIDIASDKEMMSDMALTQMVKGESVVVRDEHDTEYEPVFNARFKKS